MDKYSFWLAVIHLIFWFVDRDGDGIPDFLEEEQPGKEQTDDGSST